MRSMRFDPAPDRGAAALSRQGEMRSTPLCDHAEVISFPSGICGKNAVSRMPKLARMPDSAYVSALVF